MNTVYIMDGNFDGNDYKISYGKKGKPTSVRYIELWAPYNYEEVLKRVVLDKITNRVYGNEFWMAMEGTFLKWTRKIKCNGVICEYEVDCYKPNSQQLVCTYIVTITCQENTIKKEELEAISKNEDSERQEVIDPKRQPKKILAKWALKENFKIRYFLECLAKGKTLEVLKSEIPKATFYRYKKYCEEKGYINNGKLARRVLVAKKQPKE